MEGEKDSGSPDYMFTKLKGKPRADAKHLTSTPGNSKARGRLVLGSISNRSVPTPVVRRNLSIRKVFISQMRFNSPLIPIINMQYLA